MRRASLALARRALMTTLRRPQFLAPLVIFPSLFLAINTGGLHRSTDLPGFPHVHGFLDHFTAQDRVAIWEVNVKPKDLTGGFVEPKSDKAAAAASHVRARRVRPVRGS